MHILENYALNCGLKIDKPFVYQHYFPTPFDKFITFNVKQYPYFREVIQLIKPNLDKIGVQIVQLHASPSNVIDGCFAIQDGLTFGQYAHLMERSILHFGEDDFLFDLAGYYDIPRVILFGNSYPNSSKPYWGSPEKEKILFELGELKRPTYSQDGSAIKHIKPEDIAKNVMDLLKIEWSAPYETVYIGPLYRPQHDIIELIPDDSREDVQINGIINTVCVRMDLRFNEDFLAKVISRNKASIITAKPINLQLLQQFRNNINEIIVLVDKDSSPSLIKELSKLNLPVNAMTYLTGDELIYQKVNFFDTCILNQLEVAQFKNIPELRDGVSNLIFKSAKRTFIGKREGKCSFEAINNMPQIEADKFSKCPSEERADFMKDIQFLFIAKPKSVDV